MAAEQWLAELRRLASLRPDRLAKEAAVPALRAAVVAMAVPAVLGSRSAVAGVLVAAGALVGIALVRGSSWLPLMDAILGTSRPAEASFTSGSVEPGWEAVEKVFRANIAAGLERTTQLVVYHRGQKVVDLVGGLEPFAPYSADSVQPVYSNSKSLTAIVVALAVERGVLDYDEKIATYWPEFAQNGKEDITLAQVMRHDAGLAFYSKPLPVELGAEDKQDELAELTAKQVPIWDRKSGPKLQRNERVYHAMTRGSIINEVVRRTDPKGRSVCQILREEISERYDLPIHMGEGRPKNFASVTFDPLYFVLAKAFYKIATGKSAKPESDRFFAVFNPWSMYSGWLNSFSYANVPYAMDNMSNRDDFLSLQYPSASVVTNARSLAAVADLMCRRQILTEDVHERAVGGTKRKFDHGLYCKTTFTRGGWCLFEGRDWDESTHGFLGWGGFGGSLMAWNEERGLAVSKTISGVKATSLIGFADDERCIPIMRAVVKCAEAADAVAAK